jgi:hypothetical protein
MALSGPPKFTFGIAVPDYCLWTDIVPVGGNDCGGLN